MALEDAVFKSPRLHHIDTSNGGVSGPFWDASDRCFWLMNNRQIYIHSEDYSGSSACATIASANPDSAYPSRSQSLSGCDASLDLPTHESKHIHPESFVGVPLKSTGSKQPSRQGTPEQQLKFPQYDLSNLPPPPPFPPQRFRSVRFSPNVSYSDDPMIKHGPGPSQLSFPQRSQFVRFANEHEQGFTRSSNPSPSPSPSPYVSSYSHCSSLPTHTHSTTTSASKSTSTLESTITPPSIYNTLPRSPHYTPPKYHQDPEHEDEDFSSPSSADSYNKYPSSHRSPSSHHGHGHESQRQRIHRRRIEHDYDTDSEISDQTERKLTKQNCHRKRTPDEQKKHEKTLKGIGETGRGNMGRAVFLGALPFALFLARLAA
ncbi:hypothetical protein NHQ30_000503 [Ciborinia camelliae]|nr:hypothetical protein NHQ30_000503 [Ciborinia camelliae]